MSEVHTTYQIFKKIFTEASFINQSYEVFGTVSFIPFFILASLPLSFPPSFPFFPSFYLPFSICMLYVSLTSVHMCLLVHEPVYLHVEVRGR